MTVSGEHTINSPQLLMSFQNVSTTVLMCMFVNKYSCNSRGNQNISNRKFILVNICVVPCLFSGYNKSEQQAYYLDGIYHVITTSEHMKPLHRSMWLQRNRVQRQKKKYALTFIQGGLQSDLVQP